MKMHLSAVASRANCRCTSLTYWLHSAVEAASACAFIAGAGVQAAPQSSCPGTKALCMRSAELSCIGPLHDLQDQMLLL